MKKKSLFIASFLLFSSLTLSVFGMRATEDFDWSDHEARIKMLEQKVTVLEQEKSRPGALRQRHELSIEQIDDGKKLVIDPYFLNCHPLESSPSFQRNDHFRSMQNFLTSPEESKSKDLMTSELRNELEANELYCAQLAKLYEACVAGKKVFKERELSEHSNLGFQATFLSYYHFFIMRVNFL